MVATRSRHCRLIVSGLAAAAIIALPFVATAAGRGDQARADAAVAAFGAAATGAGYVDSGEGNDDEDPLDLGTDNDTTDSSGQPDGPEACFPDLSTVVEGDGSLIGASAQASSNTFELADPEATVSTDPFAFAGDATSIDAVVFVVDEAHQDGLGMIVDLFASSDVANCLTEALQEMDTTGDTTFSPGDFAITNQPDLGLGDQSALLTSTIHVEFDGVSSDYHSTVAIARVDRALAVVFSDWSGDVEPDFSAQDALAAAVGGL